MRRLLGTIILSLCPLVAVAAIDILYVGATDSAAHRGVLRGLSEANTQGEFLGVEYRLSDTVKPPAEPRAIIAAVSAARVIALSEQYPDIPVINIAAAATSLREACRTNLFHTGPSTAMLDDAVRQWRQKHPDSTATAQAWHPKFRKYAAAQLNMRYQDQFKQSMNDAAWAGWAAMKLLADTIVGHPDMAGHRLITELQTNLAFDGQKGSDMSFRETGQLRQPLLLVDGDEIVAEAPVRGVVKTTDLDSLGLAFCPK